MAIIQQDPRLRKEEDEQVQSGAITGTTGASIQSIPEGQSTPQTAGQAAPQALSGGSQPRSGMATNVQQYVQKNAPQAQKIAGAVTGKIGQQTGQIAQQAEQREKALQQQLSTNQQKLGSAQDFAKQQIQNILQQQPEQLGQVVSVPTPTGDRTVGGSVGGAASTQTPNVYQPTEEQTSRFQQLMRGETGIQVPQTFSLSPQQQRLQSLKQLSGGLGTESGRQAALRGTFGENRAYTGGQTALDELILGGTPGAQEALVSGADQAFTGTQNQLDQIQKQAREGISAQERAVGALPEEIQGLVTGAEGQVTSQMDASMAQELEDRQKILGEDYQTALANVQQQRENILGVSGGSKADFLDRLNQISGEGFSSGSSIDPRDIDRIRQFEETGTVTDYQTRTDPNTGKNITVPITLTGEQAKNKINESRIGIANRYAIFDELQKKLGGDNAGLLGLDKGFTDFDEKNLGWFDIKGGDIFNYQDYLQQQAQAMSPEDILKNRLQEESGVSYDDLLSGKDLNRTNIASPEQIARINALRKLSGGSEFATPEMGTGDYTTSEDIQNLLKGYTF